MVAEAAGPGPRLAPRFPVAVALPGRLADEVTRYVEGALGWQRVPREGPPSPRLVLAEQVHPGQATAVVLEAPVPQAVRAALLAGAVDVVAWPAERSRLAGCPARLPTQRPLPTAPPLLRVGGTAGGCGTSTVVLALAGLAAWAGRRTVVIGGGGLLRLAGLRGWQGPSATDLALLPPAEAAAELGRVVRPVQAVPSLALLAGGPPLPALDGWPVALVVADLGVVTEPEAADLLVSRPDAGLERVAGAVTPVVLSGPGPLSPSAAAGVLGRRPLVVLPPCARVARAGCAGRVPAALPGSYLSALAEVAPWGR